MLTECLFNVFLTFNVKCQKVTRKITMTIFLYRRKNKQERVSTGNQPRQYSQQQQSRKNGEYGVWTPIFKNKKNFIDMHIC